MRLMLWKRESKEKPEIVLFREMHGKMVKGHITNKISESDNISFIKSMPVKFTFVFTAWASSDVTSIFMYRIWEISYTFYRLFEGEEKCEPPNTVCFSSFLFWVRYSY